MDDGWKDQVVLITGGSGLIGSELTSHFARLGAKVAFSYLRNKDRADALVRTLASPRVRAYQADVSVEKEVDALVGKVEADLGPVTVLINNAGPITRNLLISMPAEEWFATINAHLSAAFFCSRRVLPEMMKARYGRIINVSSIAGVRGTPGMVHYSAAKAGLIGFSKALAREMGSKGITCNTLVLGLIESEKFESTHVNPQIRVALAAAKALSRNGRPDEIVHAVEFMAGRGSGYMTGQSIVLDGGTV